eukprot:CAMPEP_0202728962 /NCGR_PEP_ID=MMETSP1385-20130828/185891_1 /ASSEMBLY_ACC=CAM_ASM_000861 /TAXON_ID=933848 /ORGANISM="Elphidium margaritaceum" /LENGTH=358 /DNA_ID=CAMNT_0049395215 /DNA_START=301 /DNA_END=1377 /DNA_ORIENTATION=+
MSGASMNGNGINHNSNNNNCSSSRPSPSSLNYGLQIMKKPDRIIRKDADRTFLTEAKRQLLITLLQSLQTLFNDYQQTMSYVSGILLLFFEPKTVFEMMFMLGRSPKYNMSGYWRSEAVAQGIDAYVLYEIVKKVNPDLYAYLQRVQVLPDTFIQKWFGGLAVQVMPTEFLIEFWTQFFEHGFRYLFKFAVSLLQALSPMLLSIEQDYKLYEVLRVERKTKFWRSIGVRIDGVQIQTEEDAVSAFFAKVLSDANSVGKLCNIEDIDFQREREKAFDLYLRRRFLNAAQQVTWKGYVIEEDDDDEDEAADCAQCEDGFGEFWCDACQIYLCEECKDNPTGDHALNHAVRQLDIGTLNVD